MWGASNADFQVGPFVRFLKWVLVCVGGEGVGGLLSAQASDMDKPPARPYPPSPLVEASPWTLAPGLFWPGGLTPMGSSLPEGVSMTHPLSGGVDSTLSRPVSSPLLALLEQV